jgi:hypothetical protein
VCERWDHFPNFLSDMGEAPTGKHTLDRIDNSGNYEAVNCRWATMLEQGHNTRKNRRLQYDGRDLCVSEWAVVLGVQPAMLFQRIYKGWTTEEALSTRVGGVRQSRR